MTKGDEDMSSNNLSNYFKNTFISLRHRDFRIFWITQCISLMGTFMQRAAQVWLIYTITKSPLKVGLLGVCQFAPFLFLSLFAGVIVDRFPKRRIVILTQILFMLQAFSLSALVFSGAAKYWQILLLSSLFGVCQTFDMPARQSYFIELVGKEDIVNAVSLNSTIVNLAKIIGPAVAGFAMVELGPGFCFLVNGLSYIAVITGLLLIKTPDKVISKNSKDMITQIKQGLKYVLNVEALKTTLIIMGIVCTFAMNIDVIVTVFVPEVLHRGAKEYSFMLSAMGVGSFIGAIVMAGRSRRGAKRYILFTNAILVSILEISAYFQNSYMVTIILVACTGFINLTFLNMANSTLQLNSSDEFRGRVMSLYSLLNAGSTPIGNFYAGFVMEKMGAASGFFMCGAITLILTLATLYRMRRTRFKTLSN